MSVVLTWLAFMLGVVLFVYQHMNRPYEVNGLFSNTFVTNGRIDMISNLLNMMIMVSFAALCLVALSHYGLPRRFCVLSILVLVGFGFFWTVVSSFDRMWLDVVNNSPVSPSIMFMSVCVFIGFSDEIWNEVKKAVYVASVIYAAIGLYEVVRFIATYGFTQRLMTSGAIYAIVNGIMLTYFSLLLNEDCVLKHRILLFVTIATLTLCAMVMQSRSWMFHGVFLMYMYIKKISAQSENKYLIRLGFVVLITGILAALSSVLLQMSQSLLARLNTDSRSGQLIAFFSQVTFRDLFFGGGMNASYYCFGTYFQYLDNLVLLTMFKYGMIPVFAYMTLLLPPIFFGFRHKTTQCYQGAWFLLVWFAVMLGISIYVSYSTNVYNYLIYIVCGRMLYEMWHGNQHDMELNQVF